MFPVAAAYCAVSAPTGSWLWLRVQSSGSSLGSPGPGHPVSVSVMFTSLQPQPARGKPGLAGQRRRHSEDRQQRLTLLSGAQPGLRSEESTVESGSGESQWQ